MEKTKVNEMKLEFGRRECAGAMAAFTTMTLLIWLVKDLEVIYFVCFWNAIAFFILGLIFAIKDAFKDKDLKMLTCKYCGALMEEGRHSACEHSNSAYEYVGEWDGIKESRNG